MKRLAIFAHYDGDGIIDEHVIFYLQHIKTVAVDILFASDCNLQLGEEAKLAGLATLTYASRHKGYDFGSWRKCLEHIDFDVSQWDELIVANDSCFAPLYPIQKTFDLFDDCDFWGATQEWYSYVKTGLRSQEGPSFYKKDIEDIRNDFAFLNSYFMVFKKHVMENSAFINFWRQIKPMPDKAAVIENYEMRLTRLLISEGFRFSCLATRAGVISYSKFNVDVPKDFQFPWLRVLLCKTNDERLSRLDERLNNIDYPRHLIENFLRRTVGTSSPSNHFIEDEALLWRCKRLAGQWMQECIYWIKLKRISFVRGDKFKKNRDTSVVANAEEPDAQPRAQAGLIER